jgi:hypothetical protein
MQRHALLSQRTSAPAAAPDSSVPAGVALPAANVGPVSLRRQLATFGFDIGAPIAIYYLLHSLGMSNLVALSIAALPPASGVIYSLATRRRTDGVGLVVVVTVAASLIMSVVTHSPRFILAKDGLTTGLWGVWFVASVGARRPAAFIFTRPLMEGRRVFSAGSWDTLWDTEQRFRRIWRVASVMWGVGLLVDGAVRIVISYTLPIDVVPGLGGLLYPVTFVVLQIVTNTYYHWAGLYRILGARWIRPPSAPTEPTKVSQPES